jgi:hypothetical protein
MKFKILALSLVLLFGMFFLMSCDSGSSSVAEWNPELSGEQQKQIALNDVSSNTFRQLLYNDLVSQGVPPAEAEAAVDCAQAEGLRLIQQTPTEQFEVSEEEAIKLGTDLGIRAAKICQNKLA